MIRRWMALAVAWLAMSGAAAAAELAPGNGRTLHLGGFDGTVYYTVEQDGSHVVATMASGAEATPIRFIATLGPGREPDDLRAPGGRRAVPRLRDCAGSAKRCSSAIPSPFGRSTWPTNEWRHPSRHPCRESAIRTLRRNIDWRPIMNDITAIRTDVVGDTKASPEPSTGGRRADRASGLYVVRSMDEERLPPPVGAASYPAGSRELGAIRSDRPTGRQEPLLVLSDALRHCSRRACRLLPSLRDPYHHLRAGRAGGGGGTARTEQRGERLWRRPSAASLPM